MFYHFTKRLQDFRNFTLVIDDNDDDEQEEENKDENQDNEYKVEQPPLKRRRL